jgi:hypothetical protein
MNRSEFLKCEFETLRKEIEQSKERLFKLAIGGIVGIPSAYSIAEKVNLEILIYSLPLLICTIVLLYLSETFAVMRAAGYIREVIEPNIVEAAGLKGWEEWLEESGQAKRRLVDRFLTSFFYLLFVFYYVASAALAITTASTKHGTVGLASSLAILISIGILFVTFLIMNFYRATSTSSLRPK